MDTMEFVSASFFISSIVILQGGAALVEKVRRKMQLTHTHTYTHPLTHTLTYTVETKQAPECQQSTRKTVNIDQACLDLTDFINLIVHLREYEKCENT